MAQGPSLFFSSISFLPARNLKTVGRDLNIPLHLMLGYSKKSETQRDILMAPLSVPAIGTIQARTCAAIFHISDNVSKAMSYTTGSKLMVYTCGSYCFTNLTMPTYSTLITLWLFNIAMGNGPFIDGLPIKNGDFPWLC